MRNNHLLGSLQTQALYAINGSSSKNNTVVTYLTKKFTIIYKHKPCNLSTMTQPGQS